MLILFVARVNCVFGFGEKLTNHLGLFVVFIALNMILVVIKMYGVVLFDRIILRKYFETMHVQKLAES